MRKALASLVVASVLASAGSAFASTVVWQNSSNNGFFTPFDSSTPSNVKYGDSGWLGGPGAPVTGLEAITLGLVAYNPSNTDTISAGTIDVNFTFNGGDPSGLIFGSPTQLFATTVAAVPMPLLAPGGFQYFDMTIYLPGVFLNDSFNDWGMSFAVSNFNYAGKFGWQCSTAAGQITGFYTNNASFYNGSSWSLFAFGSNTNTGIAQFTATITTPAPGAAAMLGIGGLILGRRRR